MKVIRLVVIFGLLVGFLTPLQSVQADEGDGSGWDEILNSDGSVRWELLTDLGMVSQTVDWMSISIPGGPEVNLDATFHRYQTPSGNVLVLPSPATLFFMALHPDESGLSQSSGMLGNGAAILSVLVGPALTQDELAQMVAKGYINPKAFFQAVIEGRESIWSIVRMEFIFEILKMSFDSGFIVNALLLYLNGVTNCDDIPGGCTNLIPDCPDGNCVPETSSCPMPTITQSPPRLAIQKIAPENPLVIGQDPDKRGADIQASVEIPPVILTWYEEIRDPSTCDSVENGDGTGCPGPGSRYEDATGWDPSMENNPNWQVDGGEIQCIEHIEVLTEEITGVQAGAQLNPESRYWILNDLASKYYEAYIHQADFNLIPGHGQAAAGCDAASTCSAQAELLNVPFADPGTFDLNLWVYTAGTFFNWNGVAIPITQPRVLYAEDALQVYVTLVTLIPVGDVP